MIPTAATWLRSSQTTLRRAVSNLVKGSDARKHAESALLRVGLALDSLGGEVAPYRPSEGLGPEDTPKDLGVLR